MRCKKCGNELADEAKFCPECGTPVADSTNEDVSQTQEMPTPEPPKPEPPAAEPPKPEPPKPEPSKAVDASAPWYTKTPARIAMGVCGLILIVIGIVRITGAFRPSDGGIAGGGSVATITFDGGGAKEGEVAAIEAREGSTFKLPENGFTWEGHEFAGWIPSDDPDSEPLPAGFEVAAKESMSYAAAWNVQVSFDGNESDGGSMEAVMVPLDSEYELPECAFTREGYSFSAWATTLDDGEGTKLYQPGDTYLVRTPVTFYARWEPGSATRATLSITDPKQELTGSLTGWDRKAKGGILLVKNETSDTLNIDADFKFVWGKADNGHETDNAMAVAPGQTAMLYGIDLKRSDGVNYKVTCTKSESWMLPLGKNVEVKATDTAADHVTLTLTNKGEYPVVIAKVRCMAMDQEGTYYGGDSFTYGQLKPGESLEATFTKDNMYDRDAFTSFENLAFAPFVSGYVNTTGSGQ
ncbi:MAG: InlB B-repeat-containing protein [Coriobacteriales bacterium]|nr:InlB B-repeat-containing protein [Coriobacteriales bacterium]